MPKVAIALTATVQGKIFSACSCIQKYLRGMESPTKHCPTVCKAAHKEQTEQLIPGDKPTDLSLQLRNNTFL